MAIVLALVTCLVVVPLGALAVDIGQQRVARSDMQALADMVALDLARNLNGGTLGSYSMSGLQRQASTDAARNDTTVGSPPTLGVELGTTDATRFGTSGYFTEVTDPNAVPTAVRVTAGTTVSFGLARALPGGGVGSGSASRSAIASASPSGCFSIGSFALGIESGSSALLTALFDNNLAINGQVIGYEGLADTDVTLGALMAAAKVGTVSQLADVKASAFFTDLASSTIADNASLMLLGLIGGSSELDPTLTVGDLIDLTGAGADVLDSQVNLLDLVSNSLAVSNGANFVDAPTGVSIAGLAGLKVGLQVIERPRMACGAGQASTGQVRLQVRGSVAGLVNLDLGITLAQATGEIAAITCVSGQPTVMTVQTSDQALVTLQVQAAVLSGNAPEPKPSPTAGSGSRYPVPLTDASYDSGVATDSGAILVPNITLALLGIDLGPLLDTTLSVALSPLSALLTTFVRTTLGITVAGARIWPKRTPTCGVPALIG
jgi:uncharacterized membrane protein